MRILDLITAETLPVAERARALYGPPLGEDRIGAAMTTIDPTLTLHGQRATQDAIHVLLGEADGTWSLATVAHDPDSRTAGWTTWSHYPEPDRAERIFLAWARRTRYRTLDALFADPAARTSSLFAEADGFTLRLDEDEARDHAIVRLVLAAQHPDADGLRTLVGLGGFEDLTAVLPQVTAQ